MAQRSPRTRCAGTTWRARRRNRRAIPSSPRERERTKPRFAPGPVPKERPVCPVAFEPQEPRVSVSMSARPGHVSTVSIGAVRPQVEKVSTARNKPEKAA